MSSDTVREIVTRHVKGPMRGGPPARVTTTLIEEIGGDQPLTAAVMVEVDAVSDTSRTIGAVAVTGSEIVVARATKGSADVERHRLDEVQAAASWSEAVGDGSSLTALALLRGIAPPVLLRFAGKDAARVLEAMPETKREAAVRLVPASVLVSGDGTFEAGAAVAVTVTSAGIQVEGMRRPRSRVWTPQGDISSVNVDGVDQVQLRPRVAAVVAFGVLGLAARKRESVAYLVVETPGSDGVYEVKGFLPTQLKALISPLLKSASAEAATSSEGEGDAIDQLKRVGELRDAGIISDEEFAETKAALLKRIQGS